MQKKHTLLLGAHISTSGGFDQAVYRGESIGCTAIQIFTKSNRQWGAKPLSETDIYHFKNAIKNSSIFCVIAHAAYLINIGSPNIDTQKKSITALKDELNRCQSLGIPYLVLHPGTSNGANESDCLTTIIKNLNEIFKTTPGTTKLLLETMAGQGSNICYTFQQIAAVINGVDDKKRIGVCLDTCHIFAAGYDQRTPETYRHTWQQFDEIIGRQYLDVIHVNDSKKELGSRVDRHEDIGKGQIGTEAFKLLFNDPTLFDIPKILETPKEELIDDLKNMKVIENLLSNDTRQLLDIKVKNEVNHSVRQE